MLQAIGKAVREKKTLATTYDLGDVAIDFNVRPKS
jgi:hypothetical protein